MKTKVELKETRNGFTVKFNNLTEGEVLAMLHATQVYSQLSPVGMDLRSYLTNTLAGVRPSFDDSICNPCQLKEE